jgi:hypothetical protein
MRMPSPPSLTWTLGQAASSRIFPLHSAKTSSRLPAYGPRPIALVEIEAERGHADTTELDINIGAFRQFDDVLLPARKDLLPMAGVGADAEHTADVVEDDRRVGKGAGEVDRVGQLRMVLPGFEAEPERRQLGEALAEFGFANLMRRNGARGESLYRVVVVP